MLLSIGSVYAFERVQQVKKKECVFVRVYMCVGGCFTEIEKNVVCRI